MRGQLYGISVVDVVQGSGGNGVSHDARNGVKLTAVAGSEHP